MKINYCLPHPGFCSLRNASQGISKCDIALCTNQWTNHVANVGSLWDIPKNLTLCVNYFRNFSLRGRGSWGKHPLPMSFLRVSPFPVRSLSRIWQRPPPFQLTCVLFWTALPQNIWYGSVKFHFEISVIISWIKALSSKPCNKIIVIRIESKFPIIPKWIIW